MLDTGSNAPEEVRAGICIVGSGPAGMSVALELERLGVDCLLLESGTREPSAAHNALNDTRQVGIPTDPSVANRVRGLGGTSAVWGGLCRPLDAMDLERRDWVPGSGWPFGIEELATHYDTAHRILDLPPAEYDLGRLQAMGHDQPVELQDQDFRNVAFYYDSDPVRFGPRYGAQLASSSRVRVLLDATVVDIGADPTGTRIEALQVSTLAGRRFRVVARQFVLAAGAIQNARLLLNANSVHRTGLGNTHDTVGRYFLQHPVLYGPLLYLFDGRSRRLLRREGKNRVAIRTAIQPAVARQARLLNFHVFPMRQQVPGRREALLRSVPGPLRTLVQDRLGPDVGLVPEYMSDLQSVLAEGEPGRAVYEYMEVRAEQAPNRDSRILLDEARDALGVRRAVMDWRLAELDRRSASAGMRLLAAALGRHGIGRLRAGDEQLAIPDPGEGFLHGGNHQYGTTRMGDAPRTSVVDRDCRVHGLANLYVAGSSVFPTNGHANPTLTIVALSARLAAHLAGAARSG